MGRNLEDFCLVAFINLFCKLDEELYLCCPNLLLTNRFKSCFNFVAFPVWMTCDMIPATRGNRFALCQVSDATTSRDVPRCEVVLTNWPNWLGFKILTELATRNLQYLPGAKRGCPVFKKSI